MELQNNNESLLQIRENKNGISDTSEEQKWVVGWGEWVRGGCLKGP